MSLAVFLFLPCFRIPGREEETGLFQLHQVDFFTVVKVELVMHYYNLLERSTINHGYRKSEVVQ